MNIPLLNHSAGNPSIRSKARLIQCIQLSLACCQLIWGLIYGITWFDPLSLLQTNLVSAVHSVRWQFKHLALKSHPATTLDPKANWKHPLVCAAESPASVPTVRSLPAKPRAPCLGDGKGPGETQHMEEGKMLPTPTALAPVLATQFDNNHQRFGLKEASKASVRLSAASGWKQWATVAAPVFTWENKLH